MLRLSFLCLEQDGFRALIAATQNGHHGCVSILLKHGAEVDKIDAVSAVEASDLEGMCASIGCGAG